MLLIYNDVIDPAKCDLLISEHDTNPNKNVLYPQDQAFDGRVLFLQRMSPSVQEITVLIAVEIAKIVGRHFQLRLYPETVSVVRWAAGEEMAVHGDGQNFHTINRTHSVVLYLNTQNEGGEIYFPEMGTVIRPRQALMVGYDKSVLHGVSMVKQPRYTLTLWFTDKAEFSIIPGLEEAVPAAI